MARWFKVVMLCLVAVGTSGVAQAQSKGKPVLLRLKFSEGQRFDYQVVLDTTMTIEGQQGQSSWTHTLEVSWQVRSVDGNGIADASYLVHRLGTTVAPAGQAQMQADSANKNQGGPLAESMAPLFDVIIDKPVRMKIHPTGEISDVQLPHGMAEQLKKLAVGAMAAAFSEDFLKQVIQASSPDFSPKPVSVGQTWTTTRETANPAYGKQTTKTTYKYEGLEKRGDRKLAKISPQVEIAFQAKEGGNVSAEIAKQNSSGAIYLDVEAGKLVESDIKSTMRLNVTFMGNKFTQELTVVGTVRPLQARKAPPKESKTTEEAADEESADEKSADEKSAE